MKSFAGVIPHSRPWVTDSDLHLVRVAASSCQLSGNFYADAFSESLNLAGYGQGSITTRSGREALSEILALLPDEEGGEIILPTYVCREVWEAISQARFQPVLVDVDSVGLLDHNAVEAALTDRTQAVISVDLFGYKVDNTNLSRSIATTGLHARIIRDACHTLGGSTRDLPDEAIYATFYSFGATKPWTAGGVGGAYTLGNEDALAHRHGAKPRIQEETAFPLSGLEAAFGLAQMGRLEEFRERRRVIRGIYDQASEGLDCPAKRTLPEGDLYRYTFLATQGYEFAEAWFAERGITVRRGVDALLHWISEANDDHRFPQSEAIYQQQVSIPFYPGLDDVAIDRVATALGDYPR